MTRYWGFGGGVPNPGIRQEIVQQPPTTRTVSSPGGTTTTYRLRGYYIAGGVYEVWYSTSRTSSPPSGHTLIDIIVEATT